MKKNSVTFKTLIYLIIFSIAILFLVWFLQINWLKYAFENYQIELIESISNKIDPDLTTEKINESLEEYSYKKGICIQHYTNYDLYEYNTKNPSCILSLNNREITNYKNQLIRNNQKYLIIYSPKGGIKSIIYKLEVNDGIIFLNTNLEDINAATKLLKSQMIYIIISLLVLSVIVAIFISKMINKPLVKITSTAKELSKGNYNVEFEKSNIAEIDELADVLTVAASEMNKTDELKRDLISNVSHDLKTPLTMIKAYAEMIRDIPSDEEDRNKNLNIIISETDRLNVLVNDLLDLSKLEEGKTVLNIEEYDLVENIEDILEKYEIIKETENYKFEVDMPDKAIVKADKSKINQVIYNLINNAIEHTGDDLLVKISVKKQKDGYMVSITDTGKGLTEKEKTLVWNKYYKKEKKHKRNVVGSGIGLSIVKNVLEQHKFPYGIDSKLNQYTTFYFKIKK